jgi:hypothetical protein
MIVSLTTYEQFAQHVSATRKSGNRGYVRKRHHQRRLVSTTVPRSISSSLYDPTWYQSLDDEEQERLDVRSAVTVPTIVSLIFILLPHLAQSYAGALSEWSYPCLQEWATGQVKDQVDKHTFILQ